MLRVRTEELKSWSDSFFHRESNLGKYGSASSAMHEYLSKAKYYSRTDSKNLMRENYEKAAELGSTEAMLELAKFYLSIAVATQGERSRGEMWLRKAADLGDPGAKKTLGRN
jgi:hypothetical protein